MKYQEGQRFHSKLGLEWVIKKRAERGIYVVNVYHQNGRVLGIIFPDEEMIDTMLKEKMLVPMIGDSIETLLFPDGMEDEKHESE